MGEVIFQENKTDKDVADTSRQSYKKLVNSKQLEGQKQEVLEALKAMPYIPTIDELCNEKLNGWEKSTVSGRINELKKQGYIQMMGKRKSKYSKIKSKTWMLTGKNQKQKTC